MQPSHRGACLEAVAAIAERCALPILFYAQAASH